MAVYHNTSLTIVAAWAGGRHQGHRVLAGRQVLEVVRNNTTFSDRSFAAAVPSVWNVFAKRLKSFLVN